MAFLEKQLASGAQSQSSSGESSRKRKADGDMVSPLTSRPSQDLSNYQANGQNISVVGSRQNSEGQVFTGAIEQGDATQEVLLGPSGKDIS